jgi:predicted MPP superfamily phosphohydrolase
MIRHDYERMRDRWAAVRAHMEAGDEKNTIHGRRLHRNWNLFKIGLVGFEIFLRATFLYRRGVRNALDIEINEIALEFDGLPVEFDGYRVLQISDPHLDALPDMAERLSTLLSAVSVDLCVLTGDYRFRVHGPFDRVRDAFDRVLPAIDAADGTIAILGNHDTVEMIPMFEKRGVRVIVNQTISLSRGDALLQITGVDDAYYYYTEDAVTALHNAPGGFRIALAHSPDLAARAAEAGVDLYLTGHTHGGQVCLPGGWPMFTHSLADKRFTAGLWRHGRMTGYTSRGAGVSGLPVRYNCRGELTVITLRTRR